MYHIRSSDGVSSQNQQALSNALDRPFYSLSLYAFLPGKEIANIPKLVKSGI
jgi:hypothetical protein